MIKKVIFIFGVRWPLLIKNVRISTKLFFASFSENVVFFEKIVKWKNIQNLISHKKGYIHFHHQTPPPFQKRLSPQIGLSSIFSENTAFLKKLLYNKTSSPGRFRFAQKCILGEWLYNVTKGIGLVYNVSKSSIGCWKVFGSDCLRRSVQSGHMVAEGGVKPLSAIICLMK